MNEGKQPYSIIGLWNWAVVLYIKSKALQNLR